ncbi:MAG: hypothetical protein AAF512_01560 [Pseudomonadota bacterium]
MSPLVIALSIAALLLLGFCTYKAPRLTSAVWWAFAALLLGSAVLIVLLPGPLRERLLWLAFIAPFAWVAIQFWCYWDSKQWRVALSLIAVCLVSSVILFFSGPVV